MVRQQSLEAQYQHKKSLLIFNVEFCGKEANLNSERGTDSARACSTQQHRGAINTIGVIFFKLVYELWPELCLISHSDLDFYTPKYMFAPDLKNFHQGAREISHSEWDRLTKGQNTFAFIFRRRTEIFLIRIF